MSIKYSEVDSEYREKIDKLFGVANCFIEVDPGKFLIPPKFKELGERILGLEVRPNDVWLASYPRTGSTWTQEIVWCLTNNLDYDGAKLLSQMRAPIVELTAHVGNDQGDWEKIRPNSVDQVENLPSPRCIRTHLPWDLLPLHINTVKPKIIYVARNPKDCCVSYYHLCRLLYYFNGTFEDFCELFLHGKVAVGNMWEHVKEYWQRRSESNMLFLKYEDMIRNPLESVRTISEYLGKDYSNEELRQLVDHTSFSKMRNNSALNLEPIINQMYDSEKKRPDVKVIRKGQVGDWRNYMSNEMADKFDELSREKWSNIGLTFDD
ncbi:hypothetical protein V9T40_012002 [Parthenolecanium corni]|uniref:Sulfotransferase domain-containing protein n=1 Tax=Parthenolecanium corni TaxID=536013 RepID=A0AAN9XYP2_9HEMI